MHASRSARNGVTLLEMLFVLAIFSSVMAMLLSTFLAGATATRNFEDVAASTQRLNEAARIISDDLRQAVLVTNAVDGVEYPIVFTTNANAARDGHLSADGQWNHPWESFVWEEVGSGEEAPAQFQHEIRDAIVFAKVRSRSMSLAVAAEATNDEGGAFRFGIVGIDHDDNPLTPDIDVGQFLGADDQPVTQATVLDEIPFDYYDASGAKITNRTGMSGADIETVAIRVVDAFDNQTLAEGADDRPDLFAYYTVATGAGLYDLVREDVSRGHSMVILRNVVRFEIRQDFETNPYGGTKSLDQVNNEYSVEGNRLVRDLDYAPPEMILNPAAQIANVISTFALKPQYVGSPQKVFTDPYFLTFHIVTRPIARGHQGAEREVAITTSVRIRNQQ